MLIHCLSVWIARDKKRITKSVFNDNVKGIVLPSLKDLISYKSFPSTFPCFWHFSDTLQQITGKYTQTKTHTEPNKKNISHFSVVFILDEAHANMEQTLLYDIVLPTPSFPPCSFSLNCLCDADKKIYIAVNWAQFSMSFWDLYFLGWNGPESDNRSASAFAESSLVDLNFETNLNLHRYHYHNHHHHLLHL